MNKNNLPTLEKVFNRYPQLTMEQMAEICRRRILWTLRETPYEITNKYDARYAIGFIKSSFDTVDTRVFARNKEGQ